MAKDLWWERQVMIGLLHPADHNDGGYIVAGVD